MRGLLIVGLLLVMVACGQKGDLYLPSESMSSELSSPQSAQPETQSVKDQYGLFSVSR